MADPTKYTKGYSFSGFQATAPNRPLPAQNVDAELSNVETSIGQIVDGLKQIRRSDGRLQNGIVRTENLSSEINTGLEPAEAWIAGKQYAAGAVVTEDAIVYRCVVEHVSSSDFADDAANWSVMLDFKTYINTITTGAEDAFAAIGTAETDGIAAVNAAKDDAIADIEMAGDGEVQDIEDAGAAAVSAVEMQQNASLSAVTAEGDTQITRVQSSAPSTLYGSTSDALSNGVVSLASLVGGSGGTDGTFALAFSGGGGTGAAGRFVVAGGAVVSWVITNPGVNYSSAPTVAFTASSGLTGASATAVTGQREPPGKFFAVTSSAVGAAYDIYENVSGTATFRKRVYASAEARQLPAVVNNFWPCDEGRGVVLNNLVGSANIDFSATGGGTKFWGNDGKLTLTAGWFLTPSITAHAMFMVLEVAEGATANCFASPTGKAMVSNGPSPVSIPKVRMLDGWGVAEPERRTSVGTFGFNILSTGGPVAPLADFSTSETGTFVIGAVSTLGATPFTGKVICFATCSAAPTDAEARQFLNYVRGMLKPRGVYLDPADCPEQRILMVLSGESTAEGTKQFSQADALTTDQRNTWSENTFINAYNAASQSTTGKRMRRLSFRSTNANNNPPSTSTRFGMEWGILAARNAGVDDGRPQDILKVAQGSTVLYPYGSGGNNVFLETGSYTADISGTVMTVTAVASGLVMPGQRIVSSTTQAAYTATASGTGLTVSAVSSGTIEAGHGVWYSGLGVMRYITGQTSGTPGGAGVYTLNGSLTLASPTSCESRVWWAYIVSGFGTGTGGVGTYTLNLNTGPSRSYSSVAVSGSFEIQPSISRTAEALGNPNGLLRSLEMANVRKAESLARARGIGYTSLVFVEADGLNDAYMGTAAVPNAATYEGWLNNRHAARKLTYGVSSLPTVLIKPHRPNNNGTLGVDADYPNNSVGTDRLTALGYIRTACDNFDAANADVSVLNGDNYALDNAASPADWIHPSRAGYESMGQGAQAAAIALLGNYETRTVARA